MIQLAPLPITLFPWWYRIHMAQAACLSLVCTLLFCLECAHASDVGRDWGVQKTSYLDPVTGVQVWELTRATNTADNLYFHFSNFTADDRYLILTADFGGSRQIYRAEVESGRLTQLTDDPEVNAASACPDPTNPRRVYFLRKAEVMAVDIADGRVARIGEIPQPFVGGLQQPSLSGDGRWMALGKQRDEKTWEVGLMSIATGEYRPLLTQGFRIGHVQHSPTDPIVFYVWETGGYAPQRTWLVNSDGSGNRPFYARTSPTNWFTPLKEWVTHESWVKDTGEMVMINDKVGIMLVQTDGTARLVREGNYWHAAARPDGKMLVADDMQGRLWLIESATGNTRLLVTGLRAAVRAVHAHASFDHQGRYVQFHTGRTHETIALIDLSSLPQRGW
jgi:Tol biopolymer transport system component